MERRSIPHLENCKSYVKYTIKNGDNLYQISKVFHTSVHAILSLNPGIVPVQLRPGTEITICPGPGYVQTTPSTPINPLEETRSRSFSSTTAESQVNLTPPIPPINQTPNYVQYSDIDQINVHPSTSNTTMNSSYTKKISYPTRPDINLTNEYTTQNNGENIVFPRNTTSTYTNNISYPTKPDMNSTNEYTTQNNKENIVFPRNTTSTYTNNISYPTKPNMNSTNEYTTQNNKENIVFPRNTTSTYTNSISYPTKPDMNSTNEYTTQNSKENIVFPRNTTSTYTNNISYPTKPDMNSTNEYTTQNNKENIVFPRNTTSTYTNNISYPTKPNMNSINEYTTQNNKENIVSPRNNVSASMENCGCTASYDRTCHCSSPAPYTSQINVPVQKPHPVTPESASNKPSYIPPVVKISKEAPISISPVTPVVPQTTNVIPETPVSPIFPAPTAIKKPIPVIPPAPTAIEKPVPIIPPTPTVLENPVPATPPANSVVEKVIFSSNAQALPSIPSNLEKNRTMINHRSETSAPFAPQSLTKKI